MFIPCSIPHYDRAFLPSYIIIYLIYASTGLNLKRIWIRIRLQMINFETALAFFRPFPVPHGSSFSVDDSGLLSSGEMSKRPQVCLLHPIVPIPSPSWSCPVDAPSHQVSLRGASAKEISRDALIEKVSHERELRNYARRASVAALFIQVLSPFGVLLIKCEVFSLWKFVTFLGILRCLFIRDYVEIALESWTCEILPSLWWWCSHQEQNSIEKRCSV